MTDEEYKANQARIASMGDDWEVLLEEIIDDLIESGNGFDDLSSTADRAFRLRYLLNKEMGAKKNV